VGQQFVHSHLVARRPQFGQAGTLLLFDQRVHPQLFQVDLVLGLEGVHAYHDLVLAFHFLLEVISRILDLVLHEPSFDRRQRAAEIINLLDVIHGAFLDLISQVLHHVRTRQRVNGIGYTGFISDDLLRAQRGAH